MSFSVSVRQHVMIAHSLPSEVFGPAQRLHGATYVVTATFHASSLDANNLVIDMGVAHEALSEALQPLEYRNLDELPEFEGVLTSTEFLCRWIHGALGERLGNTGVERLTIELRESHVAWAEYTAPIR